MQTLLLGLVLLAFVLIVIEDVIHINKAKTTLFIGALVWILAFAFAPDPAAREEIHTQLNENLLDIATLWLFLMAAMTFVAYLNQQGLITQVVYRLLPARMTQRQLMAMMAVLALVFSSLADNITASLIMLSLLASLEIKPEQLLKYVALLVFAVNSGGVALITGDVTTLMIFLAGKVSISNLFLLIPAAILGVALLVLLLLPKNGEVMELPKFRRPIAWRDKVIALLFVVTIGLTLTLSMLFQVPPLLTFLCGLGLMFLVYQFMGGNKQAGRSVLEYMRDIEFDTLLFFLGVLLLVGMLKELKVLSYLPQLYEVMPALAANYVVGLLSALVDNVPLTAAILKSGVEMSTRDWMCLTYAAGVGGSLLVIGSAAGVIAMSKVQALTFISYLRFMHWLLLAYTLGYAATYGISTLMLT